MNSTSIKIVNFIGSCFSLWGGICFIGENELHYIYGYILFAIGHIFYIVASVTTLAKWQNYEPAKAGQLRRETGTISVGVSTPQADAAAAAASSSAMEIAGVLSMLMGSVIFLSSIVGGILLITPSTVSMALPIASWFVLCGCIAEQVGKKSFLGLIPVPVLGQFPKSLAQTIGALFLLFGNVLVLHSRYDYIGVLLYFPGSLGFFLASASEFLSPIEMRRKIHPLVSPYLSRTAL